jgi:galactose mutarotase-like enzyme
MYSIENQQLKVVISPKGAELQSIFHKTHGLEYMWSGDPAFWGKHSPILFPIVGTLKSDTYYYQNKPYSLGRHGFARDMAFEVEEQNPDTITFLLRSSPATRTKYPFAFVLRVIYRLTEDGLTATYRVENGRGHGSGDGSANGSRDGSEAEMYFSIGAHPAFKVPLAEGTAYTDYYLEFNHVETAPRWPISPEGLIEKAPAPLLKDTSRIGLTKELFAADALVFKHLTSTAVSLRSAKTTHGLTVEFSGFPFLGLWAAKNADFVCIEPWCGIADSVDTDQQLVNKEGINKLDAGSTFERTWKLTLF